MKQGAIGHGELQLAAVLPTEPLFEPGFRPREEGGLAQVLPSIDKGHRLSQSSIKR